MLLYLIGSFYHLCLTGPGISHLPGCLELLAADLYKPIRPAQNVGAPGCALPKLAFRGAYSFACLRLWFHRAFLVLRLRSVPRLTSLRRSRCPARLLSSGFGEVFLACACLRAGRKILLSRHLENERCRATNTCSRSVWDSACGSAKPSRICGEVTSSLPTASLTPNKATR